MIAFKHKSGQTANPIIAMVDPVPLISIVYKQVYACKFINYSESFYATKVVILWTDKIA